MPGGVPWTGPAGTSALAVLCAQAGHVARRPARGELRGVRVPLGKRSGIGTVIALMLPFLIALIIVWTLFFLAWYLLGIPWGIGT